MNTRIQKAVNFIESVVGELTDAQRDAIKGEIEGVALFIECDIYKEMSNSTHPSPAADVMRVFKKYIKTNEPESE